MPSSFARGAAVAITTLVAATGCGSSSDSASTADSGSEDVASELASASCPGDDLPSGSCAERDVCAHSATCRPGVRMVCNTRWTCTCNNGEWACAIAPGSGLGCVPCPGYEELDAGADAP